MKKPENVNIRTHLYRYDLGKKSEFRLVPEDSHVLISIICFLPSHKVQILHQ